MESAIYSGHIAHTRHIPKLHTFRYPFFMWYLDLDNVDHLQDLGKWFSSKKWALSRFRRADYLGEASVSLADCVRDKMNNLTGSKVTGKVFGLLNLRTAGLYFSPINFYYGFDESGKASHLLAEVSNIPWNERHYYAHCLDKPLDEKIEDKAFKVSPFNPSRNQTYKWIIGEPDEKVAINLGVHDERGHVFEASLRFTRQPFTKQSARKLMIKKPVMTAFIIAGIYWQAMKIFLKGIPYIPYEKEKA
jgi:DUF1365 family protein